MRNSDVFVAFTMPKLEQEPSPNDYEELIESTRQFYSQQLRNKFGDRFQDLELSIHKALFEHGFPNDSYNVYIEWDAMAYFTPSEHNTVPGKHWLGLAMTKTDINAYFRGHVRSLKETVFQGVTGVYIDQVDRHNEDEKKTSCPAA